MRTSALPIFFFFFQAEDGIRDIGVTGVQTCALPISVGIEIFVEHDVDLVGPGLNRSKLYATASPVLQQLDQLCFRHFGVQEEDRKSTRLNSSHANISYAVFCLKKKTYKRLTSTLAII